MPDKPSYQPERDKELEALWRKGEGVLIDWGDEDAGEPILENAWPGTPFEAGDFLYEVWAWFDTQHSKGLAWLMYELDKEAN